MAWIDENYYFDIYRGIELPHEDFERLCERACDIIESITNGAASRAISDFEAGKTDDNFQSEAAKKAAAAQTELFYMLGRGAYTNTPDSDIVSEDVGNAAVKYGSKNNTLSLGGVPISGIAYNALMLAGLLYKGI